MVGLIEGAAWSQRATVPVARLAELDGGVSFEDAATLGVAGRTVPRSVRLAGPLLGRDVLVLVLGDETSIGDDLAVLARLVAHGRLRPKIATVVDWHEADRALTALRSEGLAGKAVLAIPPEHTP